MLTTAKPEGEDGQIESRQDGAPSDDTDFAETAQHPRTPNSPLLACATYGD